MSLSTSVAVALGVIALFLYLNNARKRLTPKRAHELVSSGATLLDVRSIGEFASGHLPGAVNIAVHELSARLSELPAKDRDIVVYCQSGMRSARACSVLRSAGFTSVHDLGAMSRW